MLLCSLKTSLKLDYTSQLLISFFILMKYILLHVLLRQKKGLMPVLSERLSKLYEIKCRVKSGNFGHQVNSDIHLQTVEI